VATREQDRQRRAQIRENGPAESFTVAEIGERDSWVCGLCQDPDRLVDPARSWPHPLSPSRDHTVPLSLGGTHTRDNVKIAHWRCNHEKNNMDGPSVPMLRALLTQSLDGTPVPEAVYRADWPAPRDDRVQLRREFFLALAIERGDVAPDPGAPPRAGQVDLWLAAHHQRPQRSRKPRKIWNDEAP
jgi:hypothetical protein